MAFLEFKNVRIAGIAAGVPKNVASNLHPLSDDAISSEYTPEAFVETTGVLERRYSDYLTTSDLSFAAAERLIADLSWDKKEIEAIVFVSQTADYIFPATACILQDRLGLSRECYAEDVALGCSGWVYGLSNVASLLSGGAIKKALLLAVTQRKELKEAVTRCLAMREQQQPLNIRKAQKALSSTSAPTAVDSRQSLFLMVEAVTKCLQSPLSWKK